MCCKIATDGYWPIVHSFPVPCMPLHTCLFLTIDYLYAYADMCVCMIILAQ